MKDKFVKGNEVEVWNKRDGPSGSWCCAEIHSGNGHTYSVSYFSSTMNGGDVQRVSRKYIRPCPPLMKGPINCVPGDTVEVLDNYSWKAAEVLKVVGEGYYLVRLLASSIVYRIHMSALRFPQSWQDGNWAMSGKDLDLPIDNMGNMLPKAGNFGRQMLGGFIEVEKYSGEDNFPYGNGDYSDKHYQGFSEGRKKRAHVESCPGVARKRRAVEDGRRFDRLVAVQRPALLQKVDAVATPRTMLGGKYMHASLNNRRTRIIEEVLPILESSDTESVSSSVGSCSPHSSPYRFAHSSEDLGSEACSDDFETILVSSEPPPPPKEAVAAEIHRLELHAYQTTLAALHASGPLSWEQESLISNLRLMLNISNDEHLLEIRRLIAIESKCPLR